MVVKIKVNTIETGHILQAIQKSSRKTNILLNLTENQPEIDKIYFYTKDLYEAKYPYLINQREDVNQFKPI